MPVASELGVWLGDCVTDGDTLRVCVTLGVADWLCVAVLLGVDDTVAVSVELGLPDKLGVADCDAVSDMLGVLETVCDADGAHVRSIDASETAR